MSSNVALNVKLHSPDDWDHWENELLNQARAKDVIRILQGTEEPLKKPTNLLNDDFLTAPVAPTNLTGVNRIGAAASAGRRHRNNTAIQGEDTQPTPTPDSQETVQAETMNRTVTANWKEAYINLKEQVNQGRYISQRRIKDEYDQHLRSLKPSTRDLEAWVTKWEELLLEAERKSMVVADDVLDWSTRFLDAIRPLDDTWTTAYEITIEEKIEDGTLTRRELANGFRRNLRKIRNRRPSRVYRGSFAVQGERTDDDSDEESYRYGRQPSHSLEQFIPRWGPRMRAKKFAEDHPDLVKKIKKMHLEEGASNAQVGDFLWAGSNQVPILGYGEVDIQVHGLGGMLRILRLYNVAYCKDFVANLVSFYQLRKQGICGFMWDYYMTSHRGDEILETLKWFLDYLEKAYMISPVKIEMDNEIAKRPEVKHYLEHKKRIILQPSPAHTQALNRGAERSGAIIKTKGRSMRKGARLPFDLWPEIVRAAVYLYNQTPRYASNWKTPYDRFTTHAAWKNRIVIENQKPQLAHLKVYGCKAYALTTEYMKKENRLQRFNPRAWIGYLVGYDSTNVYRIWNPTTGRIIRTRDVIFNEDEVFSGNIEHLKDDLLHVYSFDDEYADLIDHMMDVVFDGDTVNIEPDRLKDKYTYPIPPETPPSALLAASITIVSNNDFDLHQSSALAAGMSTDGECTGGTLVQEATARERIGGAPSGVGTDRTGGSRADFEERTGGALDLRDSIGSPHLIASLDETIHGKQFPGDGFGESLRKNRECLGETPIRTNAASLTTQQGELNPWRFAFLAGTRIVSISLQQRLRSGRRLQSLLVRDLPPAPKSHREVETHPLGWLFEEAEKAHLKSHDPYRSWTTVPIGKAKGKQILDCMWIYVYKQDKKGRLVKCKARLVVKVIKKKRYMRDTYAATLAARSFRTFMAIAAASTWNLSNMMLLMPS
uniref:Retrovirus-related Pol polyprotein from transposon TNT 1-94 n=1 Tax=Talaromyces marneffei PM1 TaxID=1077442 RepID=A0A093VK87_TALMA